MTKPIHQLILLGLSLTNWSLIEARSLRNWKPVHSKASNDPLHDYSDSLLHGRSLAGEEEQFSTLDCNLQDGVEKFSTCNAWENVFVKDTTDKIVIPCGECFLLDLENEILTLAGGLHIKGKLVIPDGSKVTIKTPFIIVEGALEMTSVDIVGGTEQVKIILTGDDDVLFTPDEPNAQLCPLEGCNIGSRPVVVAGGRLNLNGLPANCPTWTYSKHVTTVIQHIDASAEFVDYDKTPIAFDFDDDIDIWSGNLGALAKHVDDLDNDGNVENSYLKVYNRKSTWQGPFYDIPVTVRQAMHHDHSYVWSANVKLSREDGKPIDCIEKGTNCLSLQINRMNKDDKIAWFDKQSDIKVKKVDEWITIGGLLTYTENEIHEDHIFSALTFRGPEAGVDISVDNFSFTNNNVIDAEKRSQSGQSICENLVTNGNGDDYKDRKMVIPFTSWFNNETLTLESENDNAYFYLKDRHVAYSSMKWEIPHSCTMAGAKYQFGMKIAVESDNDVQPRVMMKVINPEGSERKHSFDLLAKCASVNKNKGWVECNNNFIFGEKHQNAALIEILIVIPNDAYSSVKYDDIFFTPYSGLTLPRNTEKCWGPDSDILITSMGEYDEDQVSTIETNTKGYVALTTSVTIPAPVADKFPTEIALLSRNIAFESDSPDNGGHLMIMQTSRKQNIIGITFRGFGQEGVKQRYPINFRMAGSSLGTKIYRNLIIDSHQRCIVLSGTSSAKVFENVAYNNKGHCFVLQDGSEMRNEFMKNLGAKTLPATTIIDGETDHTPATFYITNPDNSFSENVAAGSADTGFWFHLSESIGGESASVYTGIKPSEIAIRTFDENIAHSNKIGLKTFPGEFNPASYSTISRSTIYRNKEAGMYFHHGKNIKVTNSVISDNLIGINVDFADNVEVDDCEIDGNTGFANPCQGLDDSRIGIKMSPNHNDPTLGGIVLKDITFKNFNDTGCAHSVATLMNEESQNDVFDNGASFAGLNYIDVETKFSACDAISKGLTKVEISDNGSLNQKGNWGGHIVSDDLKSKYEFCDSFDDCTSYCYDSTMVTHDDCNREVIVSVEAFNTGEIELKLKKEGETDYGSQGISGKLTKKDGEVDTSLWTYRRSYRISMPEGNFTGTFFKTDTDEQVWPKFAEVDLGDVPRACTHYLESVTIESAPVAEATCNELVDNSKFDDGLNSWYHSGSGITIVDGGTGTGNVLKTVDRLTSLQGMAQNLDTRCMMLDQKYEFKARVKMTSKLGAPQGCDYKLTGSGDAHCPRSNIRSNIGGELLYTDLGIGSANVPWKADEWNSIHGSFTVSDSMIAADNVVLYFDGPSKAVEISVDEVTIYSYGFMCSKLARNGDFIDGTKDWSFIGAETGIKLQDVPAGLTSELNSGSELSTIDRKQWFHGITQLFDPRCLLEPNVLGARYNVLAYVRMEDTNGNAVGCDPYGYFFGKETCPHIAIRVLNPDDGSVDELRDIGMPVGPWKMDGVNVITGSFIMSKDLVYSEKGLAFFFYKAWGGKNIIVNHVDIVRADEEDTCDNLITNGDAETMDARGWYIKGRGDLGTISIHQDSEENVLSTTSPYFRHDGTRGQLFNGMTQLLDSKCMTMNSVWKISFKMRLRNENNELIACDKQLGGFTGDDQENCPEIYIQSSTSNGGSKSSPLRNTAPGDEWFAEEWNLWTTTFTMTRSHKVLDETWIFVHKVKLGYGYDIDDFSMVPF